MGSEMCIRDSNGGIEFTYIPCLNDNNNWVDFLSNYIIQKGG